MVRLDVVTLSWTVGEIFVVLSKIGHCGGRVIVKMYDLVLVDACSSKLYSEFKDWTT